MDYLILQVEEKQVVAASFKMSGRSPELLGAAMFGLDEQQSLGDVIALIAAGVAGNPRVVLCLPPSMFAMRTVSLPLENLRKVREVLSSQLQGELPLPVDELTLDAVSIGNGDFLALWAKKSDIGHAIELCRTAGIEPQTVSSLPLAANFIEGIPADCALYDGNALTIIISGKVTFFRALDSLTASAMIPATLSALELAGAPLPPRICLLGAENSALAEAGVLPLPAGQLQQPPASGLLFKNEQTFQQLAGLYAVAKACQAGLLPDFRRGELAWTAGDVKNRKKLLLTCFLAAIAIIVLFVSKGLQYRSVNADLVSVNKSIAGLYHDVFPNRAKAVDELSEVKGEIRKLAGAESSSGHLDLLKKLADAKGNTINGLYEAEAEGRNLRVKGDARSAQSVNDFKAALAPLLATVELGEIKSRPDGTVSFSLTGTLKEGSK